MQHNSAVKLPETIHCSTGARYKILQFNTIVQQTAVQVLGTKYFRTVQKYNKLQYRCQVQNTLGQYKSTTNCRTGASYKILWYNKLQYRFQTQHSNAVQGPGTTLYSPGARHNLLQYRCQVQRTAVLFTSASNCRIVGRYNTPLRGIASICNDLSLTALN